MDLDLVVRGGIVVDGTGAPGRRSDLGIAGGRIAAVGELGSARETIDAAGCWVTPGFIDPHTYLDAQLCWDASASPSNRHGVTTVAIGLSGLGVAPSRPAHLEYLRRSLAAAEEIPLACTEIGVPFRWQSWNEYWEFLGQQPLEVNVAAYLPHSTLRYSVMGPRARSEAATDNEIREMRRQLCAALAAGALGLSTSRAGNHIDGFGDPVASRSASDEELRALVAECRGARWYIQLATRPPDELNSLLEEVERYTDWSLRSGVELCWGPLLSDWSDDQLDQILEHLQKLNDRGGRVTAQVGLLPSTTTIRFDRAERFFGFQVPAISALEPVERVRCVADSNFRRKLRLSNQSELHAWEQWIPLASLSRPRAVGKRLGELAASGGKDVIDYVCDMLLDDDFETVFQVATGNRNPEQIDRLMQNPNTLLGLGRAGAQLASANAYSYPTRLLESQVRGGRIPIETAVDLLVTRPARTLGLADRGRLIPGARADVCIVDPAEVACGELKISRDLPAGQKRVFQEGLGYRAVIVNGVPTVSYDDPTGTGPGLRVG